LKNGSPRRLALKIDCDTYEGTKNGIPNLLNVFKEARIQASFFFTLGPDNSGRAIARVFTQKGFLKKMLRSNAVSLYGPKTMLYGTLLPAPSIGKKLGTVMQMVDACGHEVGVHGWDHIRWHDRLNKMSEDDIVHDYDAAHKSFENIFGFKARSSAAPGWHATIPYLYIQDRYNLLYASNTRGGDPFFPEDSGHRFTTLEIPSTLPTWDEMWGDPQFKSENDFLDYYRQAIRTTEVHSIHTELEGTARLDLFRRQIEIWLEDGVEFVRLEDIAKEKLENRDKIPVRSLRRISIPNRGGLVSAGR
jgi:undecaprenyl phosphate-alpha-L-ara4FN deformylase